MTGGGVTLPFPRGSVGGSSKQAQKPTPGCLYFSLGWEFLAPLSHRREISG